MCKTVCLMCICIYNAYIASICIVAFTKEQGVWIVKPIASSRGRGIFLVNHVRGTIGCSYYIQDTSICLIVLRTTVHVAGMYKLVCTCNATSPSCR